MVRGMTRALTPEEMYPAGVPAVATRIVALRSGMRVRVAESTTPGTKPLLMLPGWGASIYMYRHAFELLPQRGIRPIAVDLRGFGLSDKPEWPNAYTANAYLDDLLALLDALGLERVSLVGQSMGGGVALHMALRHADRLQDLVLINPVGLVRIQIATAMRLAPRGFAKWLGPALVPRWVAAAVLKYLAYGDPSLVTEHDIDEYWAPTQLRGYVHAARAALSEFGFAPMPGNELATVRTRTLVMLGQQDRLVRGARGAAAQIPGASVHELYGGHCVNEEHPGVAYGLMARFLSGAAV